MDDDSEVYSNASHSTTSRSLFARRSRTTAGRSNTTDDPIGPLGLTTLWDPEQGAIADLIFVHGLGGGSKKTWTHDRDPELYWPQKWLSQDAGFKDVRIHSFGYDSRLDHESNLNIHDFAKSLLGSIQNCPRMPKGCEVC